MNRLDDLHNLNCCGVHPARHLRYLARNADDTFGYLLCENCPTWVEAEQLFDGCGGMLILSQKNLDWLFPGTRLAVGQVVPVFVGLKSLVERLAEPCPN